MKLFALSLIGQKYIVTRWNIQPTLLGYAVEQHHVCISRIEDDAVAQEEMHNASATGSSMYRALHSIIESPGRIHFLCYMTIIQYICMCIGGSRAVCIFLTRGHTIYIAKIGCVFLILHIWESHFYTTSKQHQSTFISRQKGEPKIFFFCGEVKE